MKSFQFLLMCKNVPKSWKNSTYVEKRESLISHLDICLFILPSLSVYPLTNVHLSFSFCSLVFSPTMSTAHALWEWISMLSSQGGQIANTPQSLPRSLTASSLTPSHLTGRVCHLKLNTIFSRDFCSSSKKNELSFS